MIQTLCNRNGCPLSRETALLSLCALHEKSVEQEIGIRRLAADTINWTRFCNLAVKNRVCSAVCKSLSKEPDLAEGPALKALIERCKETKMDALRLTVALIKVMAQFENSKIRAISLKGPLLGYSLYGDISLRESKDLDILIGREDVRIAEELLSREGYTKSSDWDRLTRKQQDFLMTSMRHFSYTNDAGVNIELHWKYPASLYDISFEEAWENRRKCIICGQAIHVLNREENLLYLIFHGCGHAWKRLKWLCDVREILRIGEVDWVSVMNKAKTRRIEHLLSQTLILLSMVFGEKTFEAVWNKKKRDHLANRLATMSIPFIEQEDELCEMYGHPLDRSYRKYLLMLNNGLLRKAVTLGRRFYPGTLEFETLRIRDEFFFVYFLIRPFYKLGRMLKDLFKKAHLQKGRYLP